MRIDWQRCVQGILTSTGYGMRTVARIVGLRKREWVLEALAGGRIVEPPFMAGLKLLDWYQELFGDTATSGLRKR